MFYLSVAVGTVSCFGWWYWRRCERRKRQERDRAYWEQVRRECPSCAERRRCREQQVAAAR